MTIYCYFEFESMCTGTWYQHAYGLGYDVLYVTCMSDRSYVKVEAVQGGSGPVVHYSIHHLCWQ